MILNHDISEVIAMYICINNYSLTDSLILTNKVFHNITKAFVEILSKPEKIFIATYIKNWRPEIDQKDYVHGEFILLDNNYDIDSWLKDTSKNIRTGLWLKCRELITLQTNILHEELSFAQNLNWSEREYNLEEYKEINSNLQFEKYYVYYFYKDYRDCYCFDIYINPYYDERLTMIDTFSHYIEIKKNKWYNHNIPLEYNGFDY